MKQDRINIRFTIVLFNLDGKQKKIILSDL